jgi:sulfite reductase alpha subunit-like flavoprotein
MSTETILPITVASGKGDPPDSAVKFWERLKAENDLKLSKRYQRDVY